MRADFEALGVKCSAISPSTGLYREKELLKQVQCPLAFSWSDAQILNCVSGSAANQKIVHQIAPA
jgi:hypothetical protein